MRGISLLTDKGLASQKELYSMEEVSNSP
jgi:hypothetical protein